MGRRFESCRAHHYYMRQTTIKNIATGITKRCDILSKNDNFLDNDSLLSMLSQDQKGFNLGIVSNLRLGKYTDLRFIPTLVFGERILNYQFTDQNNNSLKSKRIESTLIDFPISLKYKSERYNNFRTYVICGVKYSLDIASQSTIDDEGQELVKLKQQP